MTGLKLTTLNLGTLCGKITQLVPRGDDAKTGDLYLKVEPNALQSIPLSTSVRCTPEVWRDLLTQLDLPMPLTTPWMPSFPTWAFIQFKLTRAPNQPLECEALIIRARDVERKEADQQGSSRDRDVITEPLVLNVQRTGTNTQSWTGERTVFIRPDQLPYSSES